MAEDSKTESGGGNGSIQLNNTFGRRKSDLSEMTGIGSTELIKFADKQGLFIPLTDKDYPEESESNLQQLLLSIKKQMSQLQIENLQLSKMLEEERIKNHRTPDDFATAISHSIDSLQVRLNETKNPVSRFAIKEFDIEMRVYAEVTKMGTIDYRFIPPEEEVDPNRLTNIKMVVVPLPKEDQVGSWTSPDFTPMVDIEEIQGIGEAYQKRLNQSNIYTISDLLTMGTRVRSKVELAKMLEVDHDRLTDWMDQAELMTIKDIDGRSAEVLAELGIKKLNQLADQDPDQLLATYNARVAEKDRATLTAKSKETVGKWVASARAYVGAARAEVKI